MEKEQIIIHNHNEGIIEVGMVLQKILHEIEKINSNQSIIIQNQNKIMAKIDELNQTVVDLQATVDSKQAQIAAAIAAFEQTIADLTAQLGTGVTDAQLQSVIDNLSAAKSDLESTPTA